MKESEIDFNEALKKLKDIVTKLENSEVSLEEGIGLIEEGIKLHKICKDKLETAQIRITKLFNQETIAN